MGIINTCITSSPSVLERVYFIHRGRGRFQVEFRFKYSLHGDKMLSNPLPHPFFIMGSRLQAHQTRNRLSSFPSKAAWPRYFVPRGASSVLKDLRSYVRHQGLGHSGACPIFYLMIEATCFFHMKRMSYFPHEAMELCLSYLFIFLLPFDNWGSSITLNSLLFYTYFFSRFALFWHVW